MSDRLHNALKSEVIATKKVPNFDLAVAKLQWGKNDVGYSVHITSNSWISSGVQGNQLLAHVGMQNHQCPFLNGECWSMSVPEGFDLDAFAETLSGAFNGLRAAEQNLGKCGLHVTQERAHRAYYGRGSGGDGHTSAGAPNRMKEAGDEHFDFAFTFQETTDGKGWTTHRHPKTAGVSDDFAQAMRFLNIEKLEECPQFEFEECYWSFIPHSGDDFRDGNTNWAHGTFDAHTENFTAGINQLVGVNAMLKQYGLSLFKD